MTRQESYDSGEEQRVNTSDAESARTRVRELNDRLRVSGAGGTVLMTEGIAALGAAAVNEVFRAVGAFDRFSEENDPWGEHDCAILDAAGVRVIWKIDYYDRSRRFHSPDPANPKVTVRVMTVMRADEY